MRRDRVAGVDGRFGADQFSVEDGPAGVLETVGQLRHVGREFAQAKRDLGDVAAGESNPILRDVEQHADTIVFLLDAPTRVVGFDRECVRPVKVVPVAEEHRLDLLGQRPTGSFQ